MGQSQNRFTLSTVIRAVLAPLLLLTLMQSGVGQDKEFHVANSVITALAISPNGQLIAVNEYNNKVGGVLFWLFDLKTEKKRALAHQSRFSGNEGLAFSPDGKYLISNTPRVIDGEAFTTIKFWSVEFGLPEKERTVKGYAIFLSDRFLVALHSTDRKVASVYDLKSWTEVTLKGHKSQIEFAVASSDAKHLATYEKDGIVHVWDSSSGKHRYSLDRDIGAVRQLFCLQNEPLLAINNSTLLQLYNLVSGKRTERYAFFATTQAISRDGQLVALQGKVSVGRKRTTDGMHIFSRKSNKILTTLPIEKGWHARKTIFSPDGRYLIAAGDSGILRLWDLAKLKP